MEAGPIHSHKNKQYLLKKELITVGVKTNL